jgi:hypothetical protein
MTAFIDLTGEVFGRLTVVRRVGSDQHKRAMWLCRCQCGAERHVISTNLQSGNTTSCGCARRGNNNARGSSERILRDAADRFGDVMKNLARGET